MSRFAERVPIPPIDATKNRTSCQYCIVACGYTVYTWPTDAPEGGMKAAENALGVDLPASALSGQWISPGMYNRIVQDGRPHHIVIVPDKNYVVNKGNHSSRGGMNAQAIWSPFGPTADRLLTPLLKVGGVHQPISWDAALTLASGVLKHGLAKYGPQGTCLRMYAYQWFESTYAISKLYFQHIGTPNIAFHNCASFGHETTALEDTGMHTLNIAYDDAQKADVIFEVGAGSYENKTVFFTEHIMKSQAKLIVQDPRKTMDAAYAEAHGGLHLRLQPGTDVVLLNAIARVIFDNGWEDRDFLNQFSAAATDIQAEDNWRRKHFGLTIDDYKKMLRKPVYDVAHAADLTGVPAAQIQQVAELIARPKADGSRPKTLFLFEKGLIWGINYENVASLANLALVVGSIGKEGAGISRLGGHQEGFASPAEYPISRATDKGLFGEKIPNAIDEHIAQGEVRVYHVIGANPLGMTNSSQHSRAILSQLLSHGPAVESVDTDAALAALKARMDNGGMVLIAQDIYPNLTTQAADLVLPAAAWGEVNGHRINGERRSRLYEKFMESPGQAKADWWIVAQIAQRMGFAGFDWKTDEEVFTEMAPYADFGGVLQYAQQVGKSPYAVMRELPNGIQVPTKVENGQLVGTTRLFEDRKFATKSGRVMFINSDWEGLHEQTYSKLRPREDEFWVLNGRISELWQTMYTHKRIPRVLERWPANPVEIHPDDAQRLGIQSGDLISIISDRIYTSQSNTFDKGGFTAVAYVSDIVPRGTVFTYFAYPDQWMDSISPRWMHPANPVPPYKLSRARLQRTGTSGFAAQMSFKPRNLVE